jgi:hypothetical protein
MRKHTGVDGSLSLSDAAEYALGGPGRAPYEDLIPSSFVLVRSNFRPGSGGTPRLDTVDLETEAKDPQTEEKVPARIRLRADMAGDRPQTYDVRQISGPRFRGADNERVEMRIRRTISQDPTLPASIRNIYLD